MLKHRRVSEERKAQRDARTRSEHSRSRNYRSASRMSNKSARPAYSSSKSVQRKSYMERTQKIELPVRSASLSKEQSERKQKQIAKAYGVLKSITPTAKSDKSTRVSSAKA